MCNSVIYPIPISNLSILFFAGWQPNLMCSLAIIVISHPSPVTSELNRTCELLLVISTSRLKMYNTHLYEKNDHCTYGYIQAVHKFSCKMIDGKFNTVLQELTLYTVLKWQLLALLV